MFYIQKSKKTDTSFIDSIRNFLKIVLDYAVCLYVLLMLVVLPFYNEEGYTHIGTDKSAFFCKVSVNVGKNLLIPFLLYLIISVIVRVRDNKKNSVHIKTLRNSLTATDCFAALYCVALILSYISSDYRENALWGARGWYMGLVPQLIFMAIYFCVSRLWTPRKWLLLTALPASAAVFLLGCLNRFGIYPIEMAYAGSGYISTIGNINWYCGYAVTVSFLGVALLWRETDIKPIQKFLLMLYTALCFVNLIVQGSASGVVTVGVIFLILFCCSARDSVRMMMFWQEMTLFGAGGLVVYVIKRFAAEKYAMTLVDPLLEKLTYGRFSIVVTLISLVIMLTAWITGKKKHYPEKLFCILGKTAAYGSLMLLLTGAVLLIANTVHPGCIGRLSEYKIFMFDGKWGSNRGGTWAAGWQCFAEQDWLHRLVGVGPDCMPEYIYSGGNEALLEAVQKQFGTSRLTNAHNEWLTVLVNTGILGLVGYSGMMVCAVREFLKKEGKNAIVFACGFSVLAYMINNIFSFQQTISTTTIFVILGAGKAFFRRETTTCVPK